MSLAWFALRDRLCQPVYNPEISIDECTRYTSDQHRRIQAVLKGTKHWAMAWYRLKIALRGCTYDVSILREYERLECARREREHD